MHKNKYDHNILLNDIQKLDKIQHKHSLVAIQFPDTSAEKKYLVYYDERWDCKLFLNYKTVDRADEESVINKVSADLNVDKSQINCRYISSKVQEKYSESHQENRIYNHRLYEIKIQVFPEDEQEGEAVIVASNGREIVLNAETRHFFAYVPQGNTILSGTIAENMRMVKEEATDEEIIEALKIACAWEFVEKLPDTINSALGERGRGLSEGQAQRISIARAVLRNAPILLLDEATSALDVTTERKVLRNIIEQKPNKTCIVTTHRPSVLNMCQRVYRVMETKVTELDEEESSRMAMDF